MSDYAFFEYRAKLTNTGHAEEEGEPVHCMIRMKNVDRDGKRLHDIDLHQQAGDNVLYVINPGRPARLATQVFGTLLRRSCTNQERHRITAELGIARSISTTPNDRWSRTDQLSVLSAPGADTLLWHLPKESFRMSCDVTQSLVAPIGQRW